jgi:hypothetical protein
MKTKRFWGGPSLYPHVIKELVQRVPQRSALCCQAAPLKNKVKNGFSSDISLLHFLDKCDAQRSFGGFDARSSELRF